MITETAIFKNIWDTNNKYLSFPYAVWFILAVSLVIRLILAAGLGAGFDEAYYHSYALRPALSYFDHPPVVGFLAGLFTWITGVHTAFTIRLGVVLLFTVSGLVLYRLARFTLTAEEAVAAYGVYNVTPLLFICSGVMILPDGAMAFFWTLTLIYLYKILSGEGDLKYWVLGGVFNGLTLLSKYHGVLPGFFLVLYMLIYRRKMFLTVGPYLYAFFSLIMFLPVIIWNWQNGFTSFLFQGSRAVGFSLSGGDFFQGFGGQAGYLTPMIFIPMLYIMWFTFKKGIIKGNEEYRFYFFFGTLPVMFFNMISFVREILPHWTLAGYILLTVPMGRFLVSAWQKKKYARNIIKFSVWFILVVYVVGFLHIRYGILHLEKLVQKGWMTERDFYREVTMDMYGWDQVDKYLSDNNISSEDVFLFTREWYLSGEVELATQGGFIVMCFNKGGAHAYSDWDAEQDVVGKDGIFITTNRHFTDPVKHYAGVFDKISEPEIIEVKRGGVVSKLIYFYKCKNLKKRYM